MTDSTDRGVDLDQFVGEAPAGDSSPGDFMSNDQSADQSTDQATASPSRHGQRKAQR